jgi:hypothetical protein
MIIYEPLVAMKKTKANENSDPNTNISLSGSNTNAPK